MCQIWEKLVEESYLMTNISQFDENMVKIEFFKIDYLIITTLEKWKYI